MSPEYIKVGMQVNVKNLDFNFHELTKIDLGKYYKVRKLNQKGKIKEKFEDSSINLYLVKYDPIPVQISPKTKVNIQQVAIHHITELEFTNSIEFVKEEKGSKLLLWLRRGKR